MTVNAFVARWVLAALAATATIADAKPLAQTLDTRATRCNGDNLLNRLKNAKYTSQAIAFCETYINSIAFQTVTITTDAAAIPTTSALPLTTYYPTDLLTTEYPASRLSSACSCISVPVVTSTLTSYIPAVSSTSSSTSSSASSTSSSESSSASSSVASSTSTSVESSSSSSSSSASSTTSSDAVSSTSSSDVVSSTTSSDVASSTSSQASSTTSSEVASSTSSDVASSTSSDVASSTSSDVASSTSSDVASSTSSEVVITSTTSSAVPTSTPNTSLGCWTEGSGGRALAVQYTSPEMTNELCASLCTGYTYYGTEYADECYCGNTIDNHAFQTDSSSCDTPCAGDSTETCGGLSLLSLYRFGATPASSSATATPTSVPYSFSSAGCFNEPASGAKALSQRFASSKMTHELCFYDCYNAGYRAAGLEYSSECWCGNSINAEVTVADDSACNFPCAGNSSETCGGSSIIEIYLYDGDSTTPSSTSAAATPTATIVIE